ncbi:MAG: TonB-dependent receptor [Flavobacteriaceae bacterium]|uniref:TonB-dependent receptor n=1 Tax=Winogradskyella sp. SYSU M77433 TaxID=3042722 RepID=UPI000C49A650|nr:TonB-dependent receptor [Winogradskyella sp. SYSU M77433]MAX71059.1 TonB-dependent receptor [Flavobacteriaceae bacterium]MDH7913406.1 TonB-dependent receptor [Winogradskyella sp. SYSU M77433]|tara:strand:+ start:1530 stop:4352 length:2823 start_codon:yes stop_codon:yes gene_type:complete
MNKHIFTTVFFLLFTVVLVAQTGSIAGKLTDKDFNDEPLPFANILIKGTTKGTTSDMDGLYQFQDLEAGTYTLVFSFVGYETQEIPVTVTAGKVTTVNVPMGASAASLDEVVITTTTRKESEVALLLDQKKAVEIKESIGAEQLSRLGVSDASAATAKISGVSKSDGSGQLYVRGLGDRYLTTTLNGLPVPSDNIDKKNIDLGLFPSKFIQNVSISKTFSPKNSADQASGNIDIVSKEAGSKELGISLSGGLNSNAADVFDNFKVTANNKDITLGVYSRAYSADNLGNALTRQSWEPQTLSTPIDHSFSVNAGGKVGESKKLGLYFSGGQSVEHEYREGIFRQYDQGNIRDYIRDNDNVRWLRTVSTVGMFNAQYKFNSDNRLSFNTFAVNKVFEETYEAGRKGTSERFEELDNTDEGFQFVRDQNIKNTLLSVTQLSGTHNISEKNTLQWAAGFNYVDANEPNRIRNELNFINDTGLIELAFIGGTQQRKSVQEINDIEYSGRIQDEIIFKENEDGDAVYKLTFGGDIRNKQRDFTSQFFGIVEQTRGSLNPSSVDGLSEIFTEQNFNNGLLNFNPVAPDFYDGTLTSFAGFADFVAVFDKFTAQLGLRYQNDEIDVNFDVGNYIDPVTFQPRIGNSLQNYERLYPSFNLKYELSEKSAVRLAGSFSQTLPEFKEIAPFEYVSPEGLVTAGNPNIQASKNINVDLKYELFPSSDELVSLTAFYKRIEDPINKTLRLGADGSVFSYFNTGEKATVIGAELEGRVYIIKKQDSLPNLKLTGNVSYLDHVQDLKVERNSDGQVTRTFRYGNKEEVGLEGASDWITNVALTFNTGKKYPYEFTLSGNYASDRIYALGAPRNQSQPDVFFNGEIVEKGVVVLDFIFNKEINDNWSIGFTGKNLLNPTIKRFQNNQSSVTGIPSKDTVLTYSTGINTSLTINYKF